MRPNWRERAPWPNDNADEWATGMTNASATAAGDGLSISRVFDAPRRLVFQAWTKPEHVVKWFGPRDYPADRMTMDFTTGGRWRARLISTEGKKDLWVGGVFHEIVAPERLAFTFKWEEEGERGLDTLVTLTFTEQDGKTTMVFHQTPFKSDAERDGHHYGWSSTFDRLAEFLDSV